MKKTTVWMLAVLALASSACNTVQGLGRDIEKGGQAIERVAK